MTDEQNDEIARDAGFSVLEVVMSIVILGIVMSTLALTLVVTLRATPGTEERLDDARSTRALATWLSHDTTSAPPFLPENDQGGIDVSTTAGPANNDCGGDGTNLLHLQWTESTAVDTTFVANYRFVVDGESGTIVRYACHLDDGGSFSTPTAQLLTSGLDPDLVPDVTVSQPAPGADVTSVTLGLTGTSGERVAVETGSRNYADFFS